jgi:methionyl-tRNA formyltransferase
VSEVRDVNGVEVRQILERSKPDIVLVYGTKKVNETVYGAASLAALNCHGGLLPGFRGLDSNLWACLEGREDRVGVTWHVMEAELDTGAVVAEAQIIPTRSLAGLGMRSLCAEAASDLMASLLRDPCQILKVALPHVTSESVYRSAMAPPDKIRVMRKLLRATWWPR